MFYRYVISPTRDSMPTFTNLLEIPSNVSTFGWSHTESSVFTALCVTSFFLVLDPIRDILRSQKMTSHREKYINCSLCDLIFFLVPDPIQNTLETQKSVVTQRSVYLLISAWHIFSYRTKKIVTTSIILSVFRYSAPILIDSNISFFVLYI